MRKARQTITEIGSYLIRYQERSHMLDPILPSKAFNTWETFHPVILYEGQIIGSWEHQ